MSEEMTKEQARDTLRNAAWLGTDEEREMIEKAVELLCGEPCEDTINRQAALDLAVKIELPDSQTFFCISPEDVEALPPVTPKQTEITLESAIDYLNSIGWMQEHDRILTESAQSVTPKQRTGHWIECEDEVKCFCSECKEISDYPTKFCQNCGAIMVEPQESGDKG